MNDAVPDSRAFFATCPKGLEYLLRDELVALGASDVREARAGVHFAGQLVDACRACLWSRLASRILLPLASFDSADDAALYAGVQSVDWSRHLAVDGTLAVSATLAGGRKGHSRYIEQRVKDAVVDRKSTRLNSSHVAISYAVFCLKKKKKDNSIAVITVNL